MEIKKVDSSIEKRILTGMIVSTSYLKEIYPLLNLNYFQNSFIKKISRWVRDFYKDYEEAPNGHMKDIYVIESDKLKEDEKELIKEFLVSLSARYESEDSTNVPYLVDLTIHYFKKRQLEITANSILHLVKSDSVDEAEQQLLGFKKVAKNLSSWFNPFEENEMIQTFQEKEEVFFKFPGKLGEFLGGFEKGWLVGLSGAYKKGKCIAKGQLVSLANGELKKVEDVVRDKNTDILTLDEKTNRIIPGKIAHHWENGVKKCWKVTTRTKKEITVTFNHPLLSFRGWEDLTKLKIGDYIVVSENYLILWDKIIKIEYVGELETYDLAVEGTHNFIVNGVIAHNTWWLQEFALMGMLSGIKVAFFSLEMPKQSMKERIYKRLIAGTGDGGEFLYPVFDCMHNQTGECKKRERINRTPLLDINREKPSFSPSLPYRICTACRGTEDFEMEQWWTVKKRPGFDLSTASFVLKPIQDMSNNLLRMKVYPKYSANTGTIKRDLDVLAETEGFIPSLVIVDHADILSPEQSGLTGVQKEDESWMALSRLASERYSLVVTGTQVTKDGQDATTLGTKHTGRWAGKLGHVDVMLTINATPSEKENGVMRVGVMDHRHKEFNETETVTVLQNINLGQVHLDSE